MTVAGDTAVPEKFWELGKGPVRPEELRGWTLPRILFQRAIDEPHRAVFVQGDTPDGVMTFAQTLHEVSQIAAGLRALGLGEGDRIALVGGTSPTWICFDLAIISIRAITVGIYPTSSPKEIGEQLEIAECRAMVMLGHDRGEDVVDVAGQCRFVDVIITDVGAGSVKITKTIRLSALGRAHMAKYPDFYRRLIAAGHIDDPYRIFFTSGSTGRPKGVLHTQKSMVLSADALVIRHPDMRRKHQRVVAFLPLSHISPTMNNILVPMITSTVVHFIMPGQTELDLIEKTRPTYLAIMPRQYQKIATRMIEDANGFGFWRKKLYAIALADASRLTKQRWAHQRIAPWLRLRTWLGRQLVFRPMLKACGLGDVARAQTTSAAMPREVAAYLCIAGLDLREGYGSTEAPILSVQLDPFPEPGNVGKPIPADWYALQLAEDGEITMRSVTLFKEYWGDPESTAAAKPDGCYATGDIGRFDAYGNLHLVGRKRNMFITSGGKSINPEQIEDAIRNSPFISEVVAVGEGRKFVTALIEIDQPTVVAWIKESGLSIPTGYPRIAQNQSVIALIDGEIARANAELSRAAQPKRFRIVARALSSERGELTATRKVRRQNVITNFADLIEDMYGRDEDVVSKTMRTLS